MAWNWQRIWNTSDGISGYPKKSEINKMQYHERNFELWHKTGEITFSIYEDRLLFIHSDFTSSQLVLNEIGVQLLEQPKNTKLSFLSTKSEQCVQLYFEPSEFKPLKDYFQSLGFPVPTIQVHWPMKPDEPHLKSVPTRNTWLLVVIPVTFVIIIAVRGDPICNNDFKAK